MNTSGKGTEWKVGLFIVIGLAAIASMAIKFGKIGTGLKEFYTLNVEFQDASGLLKGNVVYLAGDPVGYAEKTPSLIEGKFAVTVPLRIRKGVKIPKSLDDKRSSKFFINTAGLMGDAYVSISIPENADFNDLYQDGDEVKGSRLKGLGDLTADAGGVLDELKKRLQDLKAPIKDIDEQVLSDTNLKNLETSFANIKDITTKLKETSTNLDQVIARAKTAADTLNDAMDSAKNAMSKADGVIKKVDDAATLLKPALADFGSAAKSATKALDSVRGLLAKATAGEGALGMLLNNRETSDNLKSFIRNLKERGVLFYKDRKEPQR